ncbi:MAG TPA: universal stress protein, partial [Streptosporangiaceae bacterium]|nr:universal stress protein [Streptosporangiaceae bacterium]
LAQLSGGEVRVLHVRELQPVGKFAGAIDTEDTEEVQQAVDAAVDQFSRAGIKAHGEIRRTLYGYAAREIVSSAAEHKAGVIVMGSKGHGDLVGLLLGSTAHKVIHLADRPVLVVR